MEEIDWGNRPLGVSVLAVLALASAVIAIVAGGFIASGLSTPTLVVYPYSALTGLVAVVCGTLIVVMGIVYAVAGWGMWQGKKWAWTLGVITYGFAVVLGLSEVAFGVWSGVVGLVVSLCILWYWWRPHVKVYFGKVEKHPGFGANQLVTEPPVVDDTAAEVSAAHRRSSCYGSPILAMAASAFLPSSVAVYLAGPPKKSTS